MPHDGFVRAAPQGHYWGQALQYLERATRVSASKKLTLLYKVEDERVSFRRDGTRVCSAHGTLLTRRARQPARRGGRLGGQAALAHHLGRRCLGREPALPARPLLRAAGAMALLRPVLFPVLLSLLLADTTRSRQVKEFLMRVRCRRFPPIEKDMKMVLAHCGSLFLDPTSLADVFRELVVLEALHLQPEFSRFASVEAISKKPLRLN